MKPITILLIAVISFLPKRLLACTVEDFYECSEIRVIKAEYFEDLDRVTIPATQHRLNTGSL